MDIVAALAAHGESVDATWGEDFLALIQFVAANSRDTAVHDERLIAMGREKQQQRAEILNSSALGIRVILWDEAENLAREFVVLILKIVKEGYVFYVGTTLYKQNTHPSTSSSPSSPLSSSSSRSASSRPLAVVAMSSNVMTSPGTRRALLAHNLKAASLWSFFSASKLGQ